MAPVFKHPLLLKTEIGFFHNKWMLKTQQGYTGGKAWLKATSTIAAGGGVKSNHREKSAQGQG